jgi:hypothetical protein
VKTPEAKVSEVTQVYKTRMKARGLKLPDAYRAKMLEPKADSALRDYLILAANLADVNGFVIKNVNDLYQRPQAGGFRAVVLSA